MDVAASEFFENGKYNLDFKSSEPNPDNIKEGPALQELYSGYCKNYPIISIEDPFDQDDFDSYANFTSEGVCQVILLFYLVQSGKQGLPKQNSKLVQCCA